MKTTRMCDEHLERAIVLAEYAANKPHCPCGTELDYTDGAMCAECEWLIDHDRPPHPRGSRAKGAARDARRKKLAALERERDERRGVRTPPPPPCPASVPVASIAPAAVRRHTPTTIAALNPVVGDRMRRLRRWATGAVRTTAARPASPPTARPRRAGAALPALPPCPRAA